MKQAWPFVFVVLLVVLGCEDKKPTETPTPNEPVAEDTSAKPTPKREASEPEAAKKPTPSNKASHLTEAKAKPLASAKLAGFALKGMKVKEKSEAWHEIKMTYASGETEVKVVVNDWLPSGNPEWKTLILPAKQKTMGYDSMFDKKPDKQTLMVLVGERYRVDFKTRNGNKEQLEKMAEAFDFKMLEGLK